MQDAETLPPSRQPMFNAPIVVVAMSLVLIALYGLFSLGSYEQQVRAIYDFGVVPRRFWAEAGDIDAYPGIGQKALSLLSTAFLHGSWAHVITNSGMLLAFGSPAARALGPGPVGVGKWMLLFGGSVVVGSLAYLLMAGPDAVAAVGASGGTSGLMAAAMLIGPGLVVTPPITRRFLTFTLVFVIANVVLALLGPAALGMGIAWEAHAGGYVAGALLMMALGGGRRRFGNAG